MKPLLLFLLLFTNVTSFCQTKKLYLSSFTTLDLNKRIGILDQVIAKDSLHFNAYYQRGLAKHDLGFLENAKQDYTKVCSIKPNFLKARYTLACLLFDIQDYESTIFHLDKVIEHTPKNTILTLPDVHLLKAHSYKYLKKYKEAHANYLWATTVNPSATSYYERGIFLLERKLYDKAVTDLSKSKSLDNNNPFVYFYRGTAFLMLNKPKAAIRDFKNALKFDTQDFDSHLGLAMAYYNINDVKKAETHLNLAKEILNINSLVFNNYHFNGTYWFENHKMFFIKNIKHLNKVF